MNGILRFFAKILSSVITIALIIVLFPNLSKIAAKIMPDESGAAIKTSVVLSSNMKESARLETLKVEDNGALVYEIKPAFVGTVASVNITYTYEASFGIDLSKVEMHIDRNTITFVLPKPEVMQDCLTPDEINIDKFWYPGYDEKDYESLMQKEQLACRERYLNGDLFETVWESSQQAFENTIAGWMKEMNQKLDLRFERAVH